MAIVLYDLENNRIDHLTQWDKNISIVIQGLDVNAAPEFHIANASCREAYVVSSVLANNKITVAIPNEILTDGLPFLMYAYAYGSNNSASTICTIAVPVFPRQKPAEYEYDVPETASFTWGSLKNGFSAVSGAEETEESP